MVPMWSRARKLSNVYAFATLDGLSIVLWLSAWAAMAAYVGAGSGNGDNEDPDASGCENFEYGSAGRCKLSTGVTVLGVFIMILFGVTFFISFRSVMTYRRTGMMPINMGKQEDFNVQSQDAFSTNMHDDVEEHNTDARQSYGYQQSRPEEYAPIYQADDHDLGHAPQQPVSPLGQQGLSYDTSYSGANGLQNQDTEYRSPLSPDIDPRADYGKYGKRSTGSFGN
jgi:translocation protein SEC72